jgi:two-component system sensor histidine kinase HydH
MGQCYPGAVTIQSLTALLAAIVTFAIGGSVLLRDRRRRPYNLFAILCFNLCIWHLGSFLEDMLGSEVMYFVSLCTAVLIPISSLRFFRTFLAGDVRRSAPLPRGLSTLAAGCYVAISYAIAFRELRLHRQRLFTFAFSGYVLVGLGWSLATIYATWRRTLSRVEKTRLMYLLVGGATALAVIALGFLVERIDQPDGALGSAMTALGNVLVIVYMYFLSQTLFRYRLLDLNELLGKMVVVSVFAIILALICTLLVAWIPIDRPGLFFFNTTVASFVILILFEPLRAQIEGQVFKWMFRERYELKRHIDELGRKLANVIDARDAIRLVISALEESHRVTHAAIYLADQEGTGWELQGHLGPRPVERVDPAARRPFVERLTAVKGGAPLAMEQLEREQAGRLPDDPQNETLDAIARSLDELNAGVCVPVMAQDQLLGLLCLKDERLREAYATDEIDLFRALAGQLAITLQNSKLYERMKERDRLAALGEMAAGLAHEIRNPLGSIKGAAQLLGTSTPSPTSNGSGNGQSGVPGDAATPPASGTGDTAAVPFPAEARMFVDIIVEEVNRLNNVVSQFLDYARPYRGVEDPVDVNDVVRKTAQLLTLAPGIELSLGLDESLPRATVRGDPEQLRQVFLNLAINALQAMPEGGKLTISTGLRRSGRRAGTGRFDAGGRPGSELIEVRFRDTGPGIPPADMKNLFIPFFTTKEKGTGLGLPISQRIIENHGGRIEVRSRLGVGSTFTVVLPISSETRASEEVRDTPPQAAAR